MVSSVPPPVSTTLAPQPPATKQIKVPFTEILGAAQPGGSNNVTGLQIEGAFQKQNSDIVLQLRLTNRSADKTFSVPNFLYFY